MTARNKIVEIRICGQIILVVALLLCCGVRAASLQDTLTLDEKLRYDYFFMEAVSQQTRGNFTAAFDLFRHARDINPNAAEVYYQLSGYYVDLKQDSMVRFCFEKAVELSPDNDTYQERLGQFYISQHEYDRAIATFEELYSHHRQREDVLQLLFRLYGAQGDYPKMAEMLDRLELLEGSSEQLTLTKMQVYEQQGEKGKVQKALKALVEKHPNDLNYRVMLGNWLLQNDKPEEALKEYRSVLKEEPDNEMAQMSMLDYFRAKGQDDKADALLLQLLKNHRTERDTKLTLMRQVIQDYGQEGSDSTKVLKLFDEVLAQPQQHADLYLLKAAYLLLRGMPEDFVNEAYESALEVEPDNERARLLLIQNIWASEDYEKVIELCRPAQQYNPEEMAFYYFQGFAYFQKGQSDEALETFRKGVSQINADSNPNIVADFYVIMGDILHEKQLDGEAFAAYDSCLQWKPDHVGCLNNYAYYLSVKGKDLSRAEQMSYKTIKAEPENSTYLDTYAWILFMQGRYEEAKIYIDQAIRNDSTLSNVVVEHAGDIYAMTGNVDRAVELWKQSLSGGNDSAVLIRKIQLRKYISE